MKFQEYLKLKSRVNESSVNTQFRMLNENDNPFLQFFNDLKNYTVKSSKWASKYQEQKDNEMALALLQKKNIFELGEELEEWEEQQNEIIKATVAKLPREQRTQKRTGLETQLTNNKELVKAKLKAKFDASEKRQQAKIDEIKTELGEIDKLEIKNEYLSKQWSRTKTEQTIEIDQKAAEEQADLMQELGKQTGNEQMIKSAIKAKETRLKEIADKKQKLVELEEEAKTAEAEWEEKKKKNPEAAEILASVQTLQQKMQEYLKKGMEIAKELGDVDESRAFAYLNLMTEEETEDTGDAKKEKIKKLKSELSAIREEVTKLLDSISASKLAKALGIDKPDAEDKIQGFKDQWSDTKDQYKDYKEEAEKSVEIKKKEVKETPDGTEEETPDETEEETPDETEEKTPEEKIQELKDKGFDKEDVSDPEATIPVEIKDDAGAVTSTEDKPKYKKGGEVDGKKYYKELTYDDKGKATNESYRSTFKSKVTERNSRIVPTFESFIQSRGLK